MADTSGMSNEQRNADEAMSEGENRASTSAGDYQQYTDAAGYAANTPGIGTPPPTVYPDGRTFDRETAQQGCQPPQGPFSRQDYNEQVNRGEPAQETGRAFPQNVQENLRGNGPPPLQFFPEVGSPGSVSWPEDNHPHEDAEESSREANPRFTTFSSLHAQMACKVIQYFARYMLLRAGKSEEEVCAMTREEMVRAMHLNYPTLARPLPDGPKVDPFTLAFGLSTTVIKDPVAPMNGPVSGTGNGRSDGVDGRPASASRHESPPPLIPLRTDSPEVRERVGPDSFAAAHDIPAHQLPAMPPGVASTSCGRGCRRPTALPLIHLRRPGSRPVETLGQLGPEDNLGLSGDRASCAPVAASGRCLNAVSPQPQSLSDRRRRSQRLLSRQPSSMASSTEPPPPVDIRCSSDGKKVYRLADFEIIITIGTGTFGRVCLCRERSTRMYGAMKILAISDVVRLKQVEHVKNEKSILLEVHHPFIVRLRWHHHDSSNLYMLFDYICGGELFSYLRMAGRFDERTANFYCAEIILALEYLHSLSVVYRDLKPENLMLDRQGHLKIIDFGFAKKLTGRTWTQCGTPEYLAPEIIQSRGHDEAVDWWALGVLIYEMIAGYPPFFDDNPLVIYEQILSGVIEWPRQIQPIAKDFIKKLLVQDRTKRLRNVKNRAGGIKRHQWFKGVDWCDVYNRNYVPPIIPHVNHDGDTCNFEVYPEADGKSAPGVGEKEQKLFEDF